VRVLADSYSAWSRKKTTPFSGHYLRNRSTLGLGVLSFVGIVWHKEHPPEFWHIPPGTRYIYIRTANFQLELKINRSYMHMAKIYKETCHCVLKIASVSYIQDFYS